MSKVLEQIKFETLKARKTHDEDKKSSLLPLLSDIEMIGKNKRRVVTDEDCYTILKSTIKNVKFNIEHLTPNTPQFIKANKELELLNSFLPPIPSNEEIQKEVSLLKSKGLNKGNIIKELKIKFGNFLDFSEISKQIT